MNEIYNGIYCSMTKSGGARWEGFKEVFPKAFSLDDLKDILSHPIDSVSVGLSGLKRYITSPSASKMRKTFLIDKPYMKTVLEKGNAAPGATIDDAVDIYKNLTGQLLGASIPLTTIPIATYGGLGGGLGYGGYRAAKGLGLLGEDESTKEIVE